jgi:hypothetical protein
LISLREKVRDVLEGVCAEVIYGYNRDFAPGELICWRETANRRHAQADGKEYLAELEYTIDCFAPSPEEVSALHAAADERLLGLGLRREALTEIFDPDSAVCHISARYRALADAQGNIYQ